MPLHNSEISMKNANTRIQKGISIVETMIGLLIGGVITLAGIQAYSLFFSNKEKDMNSSQANSQLDEALDNLADDLSKSNRRDAFAIRTKGRLVLVGTSCMIMNWSEGSAGTDKFKAYRLKNGAIQYNPKLMLARHAETQVIEDTTYTNACAISSQDGWRNITDSAKVNITEFAVCPLRTHVGNQGIKTVGELELQNVRTACYDKPTDDTKKIKYAWIRVSASKPGGTTTISSSDLSRLLVVEFPYEPTLRIY
jgi:hypothetical protein